MIDSITINKSTEINITAREQEVIYWTLLGNTTPRIASKLGLSNRTVESHKRNIFLKFGVNSSIEMTAFVIKNDFLKYIQQFGK